MRADGETELTSNITEDTVFDEPKPVLEDQQQPRQSLNEKTAEEKMFEAIMGFEGSEGWYWTV